MSIALDAFTDLLTVAFVAYVEPMQIMRGNFPSRAIDELEAGVEMLYKGNNTALEAFCQCSFLIIFALCFTFNAGAVLSESGGSRFFFL